MLEETVTLFGRTFDKEEWKDVALTINPDLTDEEYDTQWDEFIQLKKSKSVN
jgi:hypothetical protein